MRYGRFIQRMKMMLGKARPIVWPKGSLTTTTVVQTAGVVVLTAGMFLMTSCGQEAPYMMTNSAGSWTEMAEAVPAASTESPKRLEQMQSTEEAAELVIIVSVPGLSFYEWNGRALSKMPAMKSLIAASSLAALNVRTPERGIEDVYASINAGVPAIVPADIQAYQAEYPAWLDHEESDRTTADAASSMKHGKPLDRYTRLTGRSANEQAIIVPEIGYLAANNAGQTYRAEIGRLGDVLAEHGVRAAVFGNRDVDKFTLRDAALMLINSEGTVPHGDITERLHRQDPDRPYGFATDTMILMRRLSEFLTVQGQNVHAAESNDHSQTDIQTNLQKDLMQSLTHNRNTTADPAVVMIEYGDWFRLDQERRYYRPKEWLQARDRELSKLDEWIGGLKSYLDAELLRSGRRAQLWLMSPQPHRQAAHAKLHVTPFLIYDPAASTDSGLWTSPTTKRTGLISLHDLGPSLLAALGIEASEGWMGFPVRRIQLQDGEALGHLAWLLQDVMKMQHVYELRTMTVIPFVTYEVFVLLISLLLVVMGWRKALRWMRIPLFTLLTAPLIILLLGWHPEIEPIKQLLILVFAVILLSVLWTLFSSLTSLIIVSAVTTLVLMLDGWLGAPLVKYSIMGYDPMIGARYYGIGNEYMGVLVGCTILAAVLLIDRFRKRLRYGVDTRGADTGEGNTGGAVTGGADAGRVDAGRVDAGRVGAGGVVARGVDAGGVKSGRTDRESADTGSADTTSSAPTDSTGLPPRRRRMRFRVTDWQMAWISAGCFLLIILYMAHPQGGTNAGGALTATAAFGLVWLRLFGSERIRKLQLRRMILITGILLLCGLSVLWVLNQWLSHGGFEEKSHIGRAMDLLAAGRLDIIAGMIVRKLQMNLNLIGVSSWGKVLLTSIFVMAVLLMKPRGRLRQWQETRPEWMIGFSSIVIGSIAALALNDSGIVAAGTMIIYAAAPILLLIADETQRNPV